MPQKKLLVIASATVLLIGSGVGIAAATISPTQNTVHSKHMENPPDTLAVDTNETAVIPDPVVDTSSSSNTTSNSASVDEDTSNSTVVTVAPSKVEAFKSLIMSQATSLAPLYAWSNTDDFVAMQWLCLGRGVTESTPQEQLDQLAGFLVPQKLADGRTQYHYFSGGCRVIEDIR